MTVLQLIQRKDGYYSRLYSIQFDYVIEQNEQEVFLFSKGAQLEKAFRSLEEFRTRIFHEVRTSLNAMLCSLRLVEDGLIDNLEEEKQLIGSSCEEVRTGIFFLRNQGQSKHHDRFPPLSRGWLD